MVFEALLRPEEAERHPLEVFFYTIIVTSISIWVAYFIFPSASSIIFLFLITIALLPIVYKALQEEEEFGEKYALTEKPFLEEHEKIIKFYTAFFLGVIIAAAFWFTVLPTVYLNSMFAEQIKTTESLGAGIFATGSFIQILLNNLKVAFIAFVMSFFYGTGALFILSWNASVIAVWLGKIAKNTAYHSVSPIFGYVAGLPSLVCIAPHGIPEILAYFIAGIAGGILGIGMIRGKHDVRIMKDATIMFLLAVVLLFIGAAIEANFRLCHSI